MRFAGIRKFSGSEPARVRSLGGQVSPASAKWKQLHYSGLSSLKNGQTVYIKLTLNDRVTQVFESK